MASLRTIDTSDYTPVTPVDQPVPQMTWIEIDKIRVDDEFQRPINKHGAKAIREIAADFRWSRFAPVLLAPIEGGFYSCLDGQHRTHAAAICGFTTVPAMITTVPRTEMARAFVEINARIIRVTPYQAYRAALTAREDWAVKAHQAVSDGGCQLMTYNPSWAAKRPRQIYGLQMIRRLVDAGHGPNVSAGLSAMVAIDTGDMALWHTDVVAAWLTACAAAGATDATMLGRVFERRQLLDIVAMAERHAAREGKPVVTLRRETLLTMIQAVTQEIGEATEPAA